MLSERNVAAFSWGFINRLFFFFFFFSCNMSKYKFLVQVISKDSRQMQATIYICLSKNEKQGVDISMSIFMGGRCVEPARTGCCAQNFCLMILLEMSFYGTA